MKYSCMYHILYNSINSIGIVINLGGAVHIVEIKYSFFIWELIKI